MFALGPIGFASPWLLLGLVALPILWFLLRAVPPAPIRRRFPGVALLLGLKDEETEAERTPWWLLLLRMAAIAAAIIGFAGPVLNPEDAEAGDGPLLVLFDGSWADARDWQRRQDRAASALAEAGRNGRPVAVLSLADLPPEAPVFQSAEAQATRLPGISPKPWEPDADALEAWIGALGDALFDTVWISDGLARDSRAVLLDELRDRGAVTVFESARDVRALRPASYADGKVSVAALRARAEGSAEAEVTAHGLDPLGIERELARVPAAFEPGAVEAAAEFDLPPELRNRVTRFEIAGEASAGAVALADDALKRREVALMAGAADREGLELLSPTHYLSRALEPTADLIEGTLADILLADPDVIVFADVAKVTQEETDALLEWIEEGGLLVRFAGPRLASSDVGRQGEDPLLPVRLRVGGRSVGGTMSWGEPKSLAPFSEDSPFFGLPVPGDVAVSAQVMAEPDPELSSRTIAALADGTPLVTRRALGQGQVVLFHVSANAEWSSLPLSGLFVQMLERLAVSTRPATPSVEDLRGTTWVADRVLDGFGTLEDAGDLPGVPGERIAEGHIGPDIPPGLYAEGDRRIAVNTIAPERILMPASWPEGVRVEGLAVLREMALKGWFLGAALALLLADIIAALAVSGRLSGPRQGIAALLLVGLLMPMEARAQTEPDSAAAYEMQAASQVALAHVLTGDAELDRVAAAGLRGLSDVLTARTSVEPGAPIGVDLETDELSVLTFLYWPVTPSQAAPSARTYAKLNRFLRSGGMILFDTRDADVTGFGAASANGQKLQALAAPLDVPPLEPIPSDHVLTRTFYLLQDFPGRHVGRAVWAEAAPPDAEQAEGMPFRNLNDGVTPVVIGGNDWAAAWAVDERGLAMFPVGRGLAGERQREIAYRFGVNLIMHVLTGNYKSDQVHVPALLERLGQ
ncbi:DUF4159 domain-containing protein [Ostreiculturibacter nitratireducens]|uniref:DUF4159 domain-containing protein n=1 Tax=Ostreiculturibacter nitratireducens TaxID=3075226 RepID=UPI0031B6250C